MDFVHAGSTFGTYNDGMFSVNFLNLCSPGGNVGANIGFIKDEYYGDIPLFQAFYPYLFFFISIFAKEQGDVCFLYDFQSTLHAHFSQLTFVIESRSVYEKTGTEKMNFHRFLNRVRCGAGSGGNEDSILPRQCVDKTGFTTVAPSEESDLQAVGIGSLVHRI